MSSVCALAVTSLFYYFSFPYYIELGLTHVTEMETCIKRTPFKTQACSSFGHRFPKAGEADIPYWLLALNTLLTLAPHQQGPFSSQRGSGHIRRACSIVWLPLWCLFFGEGPHYRAGREAAVTEGLLSKAMWPSHPMPSLCCGCH